MSPATYLFPGCLLLLKICSHLSHSSLSANYLQLASANLEIAACILVIPIKVYEKAMVQVPNIKELQSRIFVQEIFHNCHVSDTCPFFNQWCIAPFITVFSFDDRLIIQHLIVNLSEVIYTT